MKETITGRDLLVISLICTGVGVLFAWGLFYRWGTAPVAKPFDAPAWVQAIGSIVAILVAFHVPFSLHKKTIAAERRKDLLRARGLAMEILPDIERMERDLEEAINIFRIEDDPEIFLSVAEGFALVPTALRSRVTVLHELGDPAKHLQLAIVRADKARRELAYASLHLSNGGWYSCEYSGDQDPMPDPADYEKTLAEAAEHIKLAVAQTRAMFDA